MDYDKNYDVVLIHPPAMFDFRKRTLFPGALATVDHIQYNKVAVGVLSIADYLDRNGYNVIIDNLADRMINDKDFNAEEHIKKLSVRVFAVGLHWHQHSQGAIEVAKLCKRFHPGSLVVLGGLTATCFHEEIIQKYDFVDAVIRGEAERPFLEFMKALDKNNRITGTPNLTYRKDDNSICVTSLMPPSEDLDEFEFTRFDLVEPRDSIYSKNRAPHWSLVVCRGCVYNCAVCGASSYSYNKYLGMRKPAFRSPEKIISDIKKLNEQGVKQIGLYQDMRMGGKEYWKKLLSLLRTEKPDLDRLTLDILAPANEEFISEIASTGIETIIYLCPDTGCEKVRRMQGRNYSNEGLLDTISLCHKYNLPVVIFFSVGLAGETHETIKETWDLWDKIYVLNSQAISQKRISNIGRCILVNGPIIGPIMLDPGSLAYDSPDKYGYKLLFKNLEEYIHAQLEPSWHQWLNYETVRADRENLVSLNHEAIDQLIYKKIKFGAFNKKQADFDSVLAITDRFAVKEINKIMKLPDNTDRESRLKSLKRTLDFFIDDTSSDGDPYGYQKQIEKMLFPQAMRRGN
jgi:B12-binding domain/radical SAM domain protein